MTIREKKNLPFNHSLNNNFSDKSAATATATILEQKLKKNRILGLESQTSETPSSSKVKFLKLKSLFSAKAFLLPFSVVVIFLVLFIINKSIDGGLWKKISPSLDFFSSSASETTQAPKSSKLPLLPSGNKELARGKSYYLKGRYPAAQSSFEKVINSAVDDNHKSVALTYLGMIAYDNEQYVRAISFFERALKYNDKDPIIFRNLALALQNRGLLKKAIVNSEKAISLEPENARNFQLLGNILFEGNDFKKAKKAYLNGLIFSPEDPMLHYNTALVDYQLGDSPSAVDHFRLAAKNSRYGKVAIQANINLGKIFSERNDFAKAATYYRIASKLSPRNGKILFYLGNSQLSLGQEKQALLTFEKALKFGSVNPGLYETLGDIYMKLDKLPAGIKAYEKARSRGKAGNIPLLTKLGSLYYKSGNLAKSEEINRKILKIAPGTNDARIALINLGNIMDEREEYAQAVAMYRKASELDPGDETAWINMALSLKQAGHITRARKAFKEAITANPDNPKPRMGLGALFFEQGFYDEAQYEYIDLLKNKPDFAPGHFGLASVYHKQNSINEAITGYQEVLRLKPKGKKGTEMVYKSRLNLALLLTQKESMNFGADFSAAAEQRNIEKNFRDSLVHAKTAIQMNPKNGYGYYVLGQVYFKRNEIGDLENAADAFRQLNAMPDADKKLLSKSHNFLGKCFFNMGKYPQAIREFSRSLDYWSGNEQAALNKKTASLRYEAKLSR